MINAAANVPATSGEFTELVSEHLDDLVTYAAHLVGDADSAVELAAGGILHAAKYPPARLRVDGKAALYRAVTRACRTGDRFPPRPHGPSRLWHRNRTPFEVESDGGDVASRMNTVKRALMTLPFERRAALLLRDLAQLHYAEVARALECSPDAASRLLAAARREFGSIYRELVI
jgi:DNA-directed RNA polymerase specialized sigma24 family protein